MVHSPLTPDGKPVAWRKESGAGFMLPVLNQGDFLHPWSPPCLTPTQGPLQGMHQLSEVDGEEKPGSFCGLQGALHSWGWERAVCQPAWCCPWPHRGTVCPSSGDREVKQSPAGRRRPSMALSLVPSLPQGQLQPIPVHLSAAILSLVRLLAQPEKSSPFFWLLRWSVGACLSPGCYMEMF